MPLIDVYEIFSQYLILNFWLVSILLKILK